MSRGFKSKFDQLRENIIKMVLGTDMPNYNEEGYVHNLCFTWPDGKRMFLNYSYLISGICAGRKQDHPHFDHAYYYAYLHTLANAI